MSDRIDLPSDRPFASLVGTPAELKQVALQFQRTLLASFGRDAAINLAPARVTRVEIKRRFDICEKWFRVMRKDLGYSLQKALDLLSTALAAELAGVPWTPPPAEKGWIVPGSSKPMTVDPRERIVLDDDDGDGELGR